MAIEYSIVCDLPKSPAEVTELLTQNLSLRFDNAIPSTLAGSGIVCNVLHQSDLGREIVSDELGISSTVRIGCRLDKYEEHDWGIESLLGICMCLILETASDLVLISNGEKCLLIRKLGTVRVDCTDPYWKVKWRAMFEQSGIPIEETSLPTL